MSLLDFSLIPTISSNSLRAPVLLFLPVIIELPGNYQRTPNFLLGCILFISIVQLLFIVQMATTMSYLLLQIGIPLIEFYLTGAYFHHMNPIIQ